MLTGAAHKERIQKDVDRFLYKYWSQWTSIHTLSSTCNANWNEVIDALLPLMRAQKIFCVNMRSGAVDNLMFSMSRPPSFVERQSIDTVEAARRVSSDD